jgi:D-glycero-D-manno-heptose 1,7-bisphosphate phosphatase
MKRELNRILFLDRDGTIIVNRHYLADADGVELIPHAAEGIARARELGYRIVVITNQAGIAKGLLTDADLTAIHERMSALLKSEGAEVDLILHCPHDSGDDCECRKPKLELYRQALATFDADPTHCAVIGDREIDIEAGNALGATTFLVRTGYGREVETTLDHKADFIVDDLNAASELLGSKPS